MLIKSNGFLSLVRFGVFKKKKKLAFWRFASFPSGPTRRASTVNCRARPGWTRNPESNEVPQVSRVTVCFVFRPERARAWQGARSRSRSRSARREKKRYGSYSKSCRPGLKALLPHTHTHTRTHTLTHSLTHALTHSLRHTRTLTHSHTHSHTRKTSKTV